jgi:hypothetical protein
MQTSYFIPGPLNFGDIHLESHGNGSLTLKSLQSPVKYGRPTMSFGALINLFSTANVLRTTIRQRSTIISIRNMCLPCCNKTSETNHTVL